MSGSLKVIIDTNIIFMAWYNPLGKCAEIIRKAREGKVQLFSPDSVKEEIIRVLKRYKLNEIDEFLNNLPIIWESKEIYAKLISKTRVKHKADKPLEALALILDCKMSKTLD